MAAGLMTIHRVPLFLCGCVLSLVTSVDAATVTVPSGGNLQAAIDAAVPGDTILLPAGAVFTGNFVLPAKGGAAFITIRSATPDGSLPAAGVRIGPASAGLLPKVRSDHNGAAFRTASGATYWRLLFLELLPSESGSSANLVELGGGGSNQTSLAAVPQHLVIDRCYIHGASWDQRRGIALNSGDTQILNSYISGIRGTNADTQALAGWNGPGPYLIENNYLEATGENILFGGSDPSISGLVPTNITIRRNLISKLAAWATSTYTLKNLIEFKNADTVLVDGNTIERNWAAGQQGYAILLTPRNSGGTSPTSVVQHVKIRNNVIRHVAAAFNILGYDDINQSRQTYDVVIANNLVYDVSTAYATAGNPANGWFAVIGNGPNAVVFDHNTIDNDGNDTFCFYTGTHGGVYGLEIVNNLMRDNAYGIFGGGSQEGVKSLAQYAPGAYVAGNAIAGAAATLYPAGNLFPTLAQWLADFVNRAAGDYHLVSTSVFRGTALDGSDIGVAFNALDAALAGSTAAPAPAPGPSVSTPFGGTPMPLPGRIEVERYDNGGEGVAYHDTTAGNSGAAYRSDDVDIKATSDSSGTYNVKSVRASEWLAYTVSVAAAGSYSLGFRVASAGTGGTIHLSIDGTAVTGAIALPDTGGWTVWKTYTAAGVMLPAGTHVLRLTVDANGSGGTAADINWIDVTAATSAWGGTPAALPGTVQAENYDKGGDGVSYHDTTAGNSGGVYRTDNVDIKTTTDSSGAYNIKSVRAGEWLAYTVSVGAAGIYTLDIRIASTGTGGTVHFTVDGSNVTGAIALPDTGGWSTWQTVTKTGVSLPAGTHVVKLIVDANGSGGTAADINWFRIR